MPSVVELPKTITGYLTQILRPSSENFAQVPRRKLSMDEAMQHRRVSSARVAIFRQVSVGPEQGLMTKDSRRTGHG